MVSFPLAAVVGMDDLRLALLLNAVDPTLGGVLVRGEKGTAKTTAVRGLAALLAPVDVLDGCRFACAPHAPNPHCPDGPHRDDAAWTRRPVRLVELPVGASEDRITGSLDLDRALADGVSVLRPGLLAAAHRGILYVDEINLLGDHLVDLLLDAAATGVAHVERDGVSARHPARFLLVGTMNPEEGELRPQLLDRFALTVQVAASRQPATRAQVVRRRLAHDRDPDAFTALWAPVQRQLTDRVATAAAHLPTVTLQDAALDAIATVCARYDVDGMRADVVLARTAMANAAWSGRDTVLAADIRTGAHLALPHRRRRGPFDAPDLDGAALAAILDDALAGLDDALDAQRGATRPRPPGQDPDTDGHPDTDGPPPPEGPGDSGPGQGEGPDGRGGPGQVPGAAAEDRTAPAGDADSTAPTGAPCPPAPGADGTGSAADDPHPTPTSPTADRRGGTGPATPPPLLLPRQGHTTAGEDPGATGVRHTGPPAALFRPRTLTVAGLGASSTPGRRSAARTSRGAIIATSADAPGLHLPATLRAAAPHQHTRGREGPGPLLHPSDRRGPRRVGREGNLVLFVVDASGSMAARTRMSTVTTAVLALLVDAYQRRDRIAMITFRGAGAQVVLAPTASVEVGAERLRALPTGGRTPLAAGLRRAGEVLRAQRRRDPSRRALLVVVTDGRATAGEDPLPIAHALRRTGAGRGPGGLAGGALSSVVVDCESGALRLGLAARLAGALGATTIPLDALGQLHPQPATPRPPATPPPRTSLVTSGKGDMR